MSVAAQRTSGSGGAIGASEVCSVCGSDGPFVRSDRPTRESFECSACGASLRYRHQAEVLLLLFASRERTLADLVRSPRVRGLDVYEPGISGPFRRLFRQHPSYVNSYLWRGVEPGVSQEGVRCEDLQALTFPDGSFDLVVSSDIFEHVRDPWLAFREVFRVLRPGGVHVFTVPFAWPLPSTTVRRVDTSTSEDRHLLEPVFHGSPVDPEGSLVYTDFGLDLPERLRELGFRTSVHHGYRNNLTLASARPAERDGGVAPGVWGP